MWAVKLIENFSHQSFVHYGIYPRHFDSILGIITSPFIHADFAHLISNSLPVIVSGAIIFYFYRSIAFSVFAWIFFATGFWVWAMARNAYHIGASGLVYGLIGFLLFSGIFRKNKQLLALSLFVTFLYGSFVWGLLPLKEEISYESHLLGFIAGLITAYNFRKEGPQNEVYHWDESEDDLEEIDLETLDEESDIAEEEKVNEIKIKYTLKEEEKPKLKI